MSELFAISQDPATAVHHLTSLQLPTQTQGSKTRLLINGNALTRRDDRGKKIKDAGEYLNFRAYALCPDTPEHREAMKTVRTLERQAENWGFAAQMMKLTPVTLISLLSVVHYIGGVKIPYLVDGIGPGQWGILTGTLMNLNPLPLMAGVLHTMITGGKWFGLRGFFTRGGLTFACSAALLFLVNRRARACLEEAWELRQQRIQPGMRELYSRICQDYLYQELRAVRDSGDEERLDDLASTARHLINNKELIAKIYGADVEAYEEKIAAPCRRIEMFVEAIRHRDSAEPVVQLGLIQEAIHDFDMRVRDGSAPITLEGRASCLQLEIDRLRAEETAARLRGQHTKVAELNTKLANYNRAKAETERLIQQRWQEEEAAGDSEAELNRIKLKYGEYRWHLRDAYVVAYYMSGISATYTEVLNEYRTGLRGFKYVASREAPPPGNRPELITWLSYKMLSGEAAEKEQLLRIHDVYLWHTQRERVYVEQPVADEQFGIKEVAAEDGAAHEGTSSESSTAPSNESDSQAA